MSTLNMAPVSITLTVAHIQQDGGDPGGRSAIQYATARSGNSWDAPVRSESRDLGA